MTQHPETHLLQGACTNCGSRFQLRTTAQSLSIDICSNCHPAYTGARHATPTGDRIKRFKRRRALATA